MKGLDRAWIAASLYVLGSWRREQQEVWGSDSCEMFCDSGRKYFFSRREE